MSDRIITPTLRELMEELADVNWYSLGANLLVPVSKLNDITASHPQGGTDMWRIELLEYWLNSTPTASWSDIITALENMGHRTLSTRLRSKYLPSDTTTTVGYSIHDAGRPAPVPALPPDYAQEPARDRTPINRDVQMDDDGEEPGKSGRVVKDGASASNTDVKITSSTHGKTWSPYKMNKDSSHGVALIINNFEWQRNKDGKLLMKTRDGAKKDAEALEESLKAIGYHVICKENLTAEKMKQKLKKVCAQNIRPEDDSFICYISSHGCELGVYGVDKEYVSVDELSKILKPDVCPKLKHKPKIFFVQACRGSSASTPVDDDSEEVFVSRVPYKADFYFSYATVPDDVAVRHPYPEHLSEYLKEHSAQLSLDEIVMKVHEKIARKVYDLVLKGERHEHMQIGEVVHTMRGPVYFK